MTPFLQFCRAAFRALYDLPEHETGEEGVEIPPEWMRYASQHRVMGLLEAGISFSNRQSESDAEDWKRKVFGQARHSARSATEAERIVAGLNQNGLQPVLIKGPALAVQAWPDPGLRSFDDLDFRCPRESYAKLVPALYELGYKPEIESETRRSHLWLFGWGIGFVGTGGLRAEFNHRMFPPHYPWPRTVNLHHPPFVETMTLDQAVVRTLSPAMHLLLSCLHSVWHGWERLAWLVDIAGLLVRRPGSYDQARAWVQHPGFPQRAFNAGCAVAEALFGPGILPRPLPHEPAPVMEDALRGLTRTTPGLTLAEQRHCHNRLMSQREILRYQLARWTIPGGNDFNFIDLPEPLRGLYWMIRPIRALMDRSTRPSGT